MGCDRGTGRAKAENGETMGVEEGVSGVMEDQHTSI